MIYRALKTIRLYHNIKQSELAEIFGMILSRMILASLISVVPVVRMAQIERWRQA